MFLNYKGMKNKILTADFELDSDEWEHVSQVRILILISVRYYLKKNSIICDSNKEAKNLIIRIFKTNPKQRPTIYDLESDEWMKNFSSLPNTDVRPTSILTIDNNAWIEYEEATEIELNQLRINSVEIKKLESINNPLLKKRNQKQKIKRNVSFDPDQTNAIRNGLLDFSKQTIYGSDTTL